MDRQPYGGLGPSELPRLYFNSMFLTLGGNPSACCTRRQGSSPCPLSGGCPPPSHTRSPLPNERIQRVCVASMFIACCDCSRLNMLENAVILPQLLLHRLAWLRWRGDAAGRGRSCVRLCSWFVSAPAFVPVLTRPAASLSRGVLDSRPRTVVGRRVQRCIRRAPGFWVRFWVRGSGFETSHALWFWFSVRSVQQHPIRCTLPTHNHAMVHV
jgi:hypothetical protein